MSSFQNGNPAGNTLPDANAYFCCNCRFGPMLYVLHPACIECGTPACQYCQPTSVLNHPGQHPEPAPQDQETTWPRDPYGESVLGFNRPPSPMMDRFFQEQPTVTERLLTGAAPKSLTGILNQMEGVVRQLRYAGNDSSPGM